MTIAAAAALALSGMAVAQSGPEQQLRILAGKRLAERSCAQCHNISAKGESRMQGAPPLREVGERYDFERLLAPAIRNGMLTEHPMMPELRLSKGEIEDLIVFLRSLQTLQAVSAGQAPAG